MKIFRTLFVVTVLAAAPGAFAGQLAFSLLAPTPHADDAQNVEISLAVLNAGTTSVSLTIPAQLAGTITSPDGPCEVELTAVTRPPSDLEPGRFAIVPYRLQLPAPSDGAILSVSPPSGPRLQLVLSEATAAAPSIGPETPPHPHALVPNNVESAIQRVFAERFAPHEPVYFIYGSDDPVAKFQFSLKYRLLDFDGNKGQAPLKTLQFGYTQRSVWDINETSSPFYDTSYIPELFYESIAAPAEDAAQIIHGLGLQTGFLHESNGRDGTASRSLNQLFVRSFFLLGSTERWHAIVAPELWIYVGAMDDNPRLKDYRGYGRLRCALGYGDGTSLTLLSYCGKDFDHPTVQLDLAVPMQFGLFDFKTFFLVQYFNGYGENLRDYQKHSQTLRAGMALVR